MTNIPACPGTRIRTPDPDSSTDLPFLPGLRASTETTAGDIFLETVSKRSPRRTDSPGATATLLSPSA
ncbi:hypothetical protein EBX93_10955 [bacterium]|nr:hypothetical protein [bacterium]